MYRKDKWKMGFVYCSLDESMKIMVVKCDKKNWLNESNQVGSRDRLSNYYQCICSTDRVCRRPEK